MDKKKNIRLRANVDTAENEAVNEETRTVIDIVVKTAANVGLVAIGVVVGAIMGKHKGT